jgi:hypothetical protein
MSAIRSAIKTIVGTEASSNQAVRATVRRAPSYELLEGRQLLNRGWGFAGGPGMWDGSTGKLDPAHVHNWSGMRAFEKHHGNGPAAGSPGAMGHDLLATNPQAKADMQTLRNDVKTLQSEVPAALQSQIKADKATIEKALSSLSPAQFKAAHLATSPGTPPSDPTAFLTTQLQAANVPASQISQITTDFQNYKTSLQTVDPTLYAKITADEATLAKDLPAGHHAPPQVDPLSLMGPQF